MFGKTKSSNDRFVMMKGREVGNIKKVTSPAKPGTGKQHVAHTGFGHNNTKTAPLKTMDKGSKPMSMVPKSATYSGVLRQSAGKTEKNMGKITK